MNKVALYITTNDNSFRTIQKGYIDTLRHLGWTVYVGGPKTKICCSEWIQSHDIRLIITNSIHGIEQLPVDAINNNNVFVIINVIPLSIDCNDFDKITHSYELNLIKRIKNIFVYTSITPIGWTKCIPEWTSGDVDVKYLPVAGNIVDAIPTTRTVLTDVSMVANFAHKQNVMSSLICPLFKRLELLGYSYQVFGDNTWEINGIKSNGEINCNNSQFSTIYATSKVCPNVHTTQQLSCKTYINDRSFMIPLYGGVQVSDNPMSEEYLDGHCYTEANETDFINRIIELSCSECRDFEKIKSAAKYVAYNHTYFNRLEDIFKSVGLKDFSDETKVKGDRLAARHCWELDAQLDAEKRGVQYVRQTV